MQERYKKFYNQYKNKLFSYLVYLSGDTETSQDIMQESFTRHFKHYRNDAAISPALLFTIARNLYLEGQRNTHQQISLEDFYADPSPNPEQVVETHLEIRSIRNFLQTLPEIDRTAFIMRVQNELPYAEIARILEISLSSAKVKVHRVRKKLITISLSQEEVPI